MLKALLGKKASQAIETSRIGGTRVGQVVSTHLDPEKREIETSNNMSRVVDEMRHPYFRKRIIAVAVAVNLVSWLSLLLLTRVVSRLVLVAALLFSKGGMLLTLPAFAATILGVYALFRIWLPERETEPHSDSDVMASYQQQNDSLMTWKIWVVSCGSGAVNCILLMVVYMYLSGDWQQYTR